MDSTCSDGVDQNLIHIHTQPLILSFYDFYNLIEQLGGHKVGLIGKHTKHQPLTGSLHLLPLLLSFPILIQIKPDLTLPLVGAEQSCPLRLWSLPCHFQADLSGISAEHTQAFLEWDSGEHAVLQADFCPGP